MNIYNDYISTDMDSFKEFEKFCEECWKEEYSYVVIDLSKNPESGYKYRKCFDGLFIPDKFA
jgi:hypothetical protein